MMQNNNPWAMVSIVLTAIVIIGGGLYYWQMGNTPTPFTYDLNGVPASVAKVTGKFNYTATQLANNAEECGAPQSAEYFNNLVAKFNGASTTMYNFKYTGASQQADTFTVTAVPNKAGYTTIAGFEKDFGICNAGGNAYPHAVNADWLIFTSSCGGFDDGSGKPVGCDEIKSAIEASLKLK